MEIQFVYQKKRSEFGRQCLFSDKGPDLIDNFPSNKKFLQRYILRDPVHNESQCAAVQAEHYLNTTRAEYTNSLMSHVEGGWPKDVNLADEEQPKRYRRKIEKDEGFHHTVMQLCKNMENCILQNNAINIYQQYFSDVEPTPLIDKSSARTVNVYQDQTVPPRPVTHISWSPDNATKLAISHCNLNFQSPQSLRGNQSYIWEVENPNSPLYVFNSQHPTVCLEYNQKDPNSLVSGQFNGQVAVWDTRKGKDPVELSLIENSFRDPVHNVLWINSKSGMEFFSSSTDGQLKWWDTRKMSEPTENLIMDISKDGQQSMSNALGASALEYESTIPTRFMVGTEQGIVFSGNRKGKSATEKLGLKFQAHYGPVLALQRNPAFVKNFLTIGDWTARIWSEDCRESSIMWTSFHRAMLTDGAWSPTRLSVFFTTRSDGILDVWDILQQQKQASLSIKVCDEPLKCIRTHEMGQLIAVGNQSGTTYLVELSDNLAASNKNDKMLLTAMFEREGKREKILEARNREIRLKQRAAPTHKTDMEGSDTALDVEKGGDASDPAIAGGAGAAEAEIENFFDDHNVVQAEAEFYLVIEQELKGPEPPVEEEEVAEVAVVEEVAPVKEEEIESIVSVAEKKEEKKGGKGKKGEKEGKKEEKGEKKGGEGKKKKKK